MLGRHAHNAPQRMFQVRVLGGCRARGVAQGALERGLPCVIRTVPDGNLAYAGSPHLLETGATNSNTGAFVAVTPDAALCPGLLT